MKKNTRAATLKPKQNEYVTADAFKLLEEKQKKLEENYKSLKRLVDSLNDDLDKEYLKLDKAADDIAELEPALKKIKTQIDETMIPHTINHCTQLQVHQNLLEDVTALTMGLMDGIEKHDHPLFVECFTAAQKFSDDIEEKKKVRNMVDSLYAKQSSA